jgi:hypothetical protein
MSVLVPSLEEFERFLVLLKQYCKACEIVIKSERVKRWVMSENPYVTCAVLWREISAQIKSPAFLVPLGWPEAVRATISKLFAVHVYRGEAVPLKLQELNSLRESLETATPGRCESSIETEDNRFLIGLFGLAAFDRKNATNTCSALRKAGIAKHEHTSSVRAMVDRLKKAGLIDTCQGVGVWLTPAGKNVAESLSH